MHSGHCALSLPKVNERYVVIKAMNKLLDPNPGLGLDEQRLCQVALLAR
jgi:hypothetical protein